MREEEGSEGKGRKGRAGKDEKVRDENRLLVLLPPNNPRPSKWPYKEHIIRSRLRQGLFNYRAMVHRTMFVVNIQRELTVCSSS